ncbi:MAG: DUF1648 domain-containing protein [Candidatus Methanomethylophilaceae archaeon]|jgi:hypothetical protein|nr:DUF1648 domain-containing protein [Candidatus Methanomethylophilaceae archaeon]
MKRDIKRILAPADTLEWIVAALWLLLWIFMIASALMFPGKIPIHYDALGEPDRYANFLESMIVPALASLVNVLLIYLARFLGREGTYSSQVTRDTIKILTIGVNVLILFMAFALVWTSV